MSYDLVVWVGSRPATPDAADTEYERRMDAMEAHFEEEGETPEPAAELIAFVEAALARYPELDDESGAECPWASSPLINEVVGDLIYFPLTFSGAEYARDVLAEIADAMGLVCYDPQIDGLLPNASATPAREIGAQAATALEAPAQHHGEPQRRSGWFRRLLNVRR